MTRTTREVNDRGPARVALTITRSWPTWGPSRREHRPSAEDARAPLYSQPVARSFALAPAATAAPAAPTPVPTSALRPPPPREVVQPAIDVERLSEDVYRHMQRKIRIERERRGF